MRVRRPFPCDERTGREIGEYSCDPVRNSSWGAKRRISVDGSAKETPLSFCHCRRGGYFSKIFPLLAVGGSRVSFCSAVRGGYSPKRGGFFFSLDGMGRGGLTSFPLHAGRGGDFFLSVCGGERTLSVFSPPRLGGYSPKRGGGFFSPPWLTG